MLDRDSLWARIRAFGEIERQIEQSIASAMRKNKELRDAGDLQAAAAQWDVVERNRPRLKSVQRLIRDLEARYYGRKA